MKNNVSGKVCFTYSAGGHYTELTKAINGIEWSNSYHVTFDTGRFTNIDSERRLYVTHPRKKIFRTIKNAYESLIILWKERPEVIISTGADVTVPTIIFGKVFFGAKVIFIESAGDLTPTLTGRIVYRFTDLFIIQWAEQFKYYPKAALSKGLLL